MVAMNAADVEREANVIIERTGYPRERFYTDLIEDEGYIAINGGVTRIKDEMFLDTLNYAFRTIYHVDFTTEPVDDGIRLDGEITADVEGHVRLGTIDVVVADVDDADKKLGDILAGYDLVASRLLADWGPESLSGGVQYLDAQPTHAPKFDASVLRGL